ncbi:MAG TPA: type IV pilus modification protein PilV [Gammaproteobacteria bacterium]|nr:type IV pilus modification protein PilV [Gammaproteobacteria bacterium]
MRIPQRQAGFTLLEILIALIILSIGLLGLAGLQANSLKNNNSAYQRTQASLLANEMLDRIRANRQGLETGAYDAIDSTSTSDPGCITSGCSNMQMAQYDAHDWSDRLANLLPSGQGTVSGGGANSVFTITVMWDDARTGATGTACSGDTSVDLTCFTLSTRP